MNKTISIRPSKDLRTNYAQIVTTMVKCPFFNTIDCR